MEVQSYNGEKHKLNSVKNNKLKYIFFLLLPRHTAVSHISTFATFVFF